MKDGDGGSVAPAGVWLVWVLRGVGRAVMLVCVFVLGSCRGEMESRGGTGEGAGPFVGGGTPACRYGETGRGMGGWVGRCRP